MTAIAPSNSRGMGWRKPVPAFIPTPPTSRPTSDTSFAFPAVLSGGDADKRPTDGNSGPEDVLPPMPDNWLSIVRSASQDVYSDRIRFQRRAAPTISGRQPVHEFSRTVSTMTDDRRSHSSRSHYMHRGALPKVYRPPTPPITSVRRPRSVAIPGMLERQMSPGGTFHMIYPDPPSLAMATRKTSLQTLHHCPPPSPCMSESTRLPTSVKTKPSLQSLSSEDHTAVSSHAGHVGSWYHLPDGQHWQAEWNMRLALKRQDEKGMLDVRKETDGKSELPMHYIPASKLRKTRKQRRSCSDMLWSAMVSAGRAITSVFKTVPVEVDSSSDALPK